MKLNKKTTVITGYCLLGAIFFLSIGFGAGVFLTDTGKTTDINQLTIGETREVFDQLKTQCGSAGYRNDIVLYDETGHFYGNTNVDVPPMLFCVNSTSQRAEPVVTFNKTTDGDEA